MNFIPLSSPDIRQEDIDAVNIVLHSGMLVQSKNVEAFEEAVGAFIGTPHAIAVSNGTATMHLALIALGIGVGDEVIVPAFSYVATANVVELVGATPVFVDIDLKTFNIDVAKVEAKINSNTKAIIPVHEFGLACDIESIVEIAKKHKLHIIEDAACALGATQNGRYVGTFGVFGSFSFHPRKAVSSGEGGILTTNNSLLSAKIKTLRNHGIEIIDEKMEFVEAGYNYRMTDFQAALVNSQFKRFSDIIEYKQTLAQIYMEEINNPKFILPHTPNDRSHTWQTYHILVDDSIDRDELIISLKNKGIGTNYGAQCIPAQKYYLNKYGYNSAMEFPNAYDAYKKGIALPIYEKLNKEQIQYISKTINQIKQNDTK